MTTQEDSVDPRARWRVLPPDVRPDLEVHPVDDPPAVMDQAAMFDPVTGLLRHVG